MTAFVPFGRFRNRLFGLLSGTGVVTITSRRTHPHVNATFSVPGTGGNRPESNGSRFFPSLDGNRDQDQPRGVL
jgi:hypothetical protein